MKLLTYAKCLRLLTNEENVFKPSIQQAFVSQYIISAINPLPPYHSTQLLSESQKIDMTSHLVIITISSEQMEFSHLNDDY